LPRCRYPLGVGASLEIVFGRDSMFLEDFNFPKVT